MEKTKLDDSSSKLKNQNNIVSDQTQEVAKANVEYEKVQESLPNMRLKESQIAAELQKHTINLENQETSPSLMNIDESCDDDNNELKLRM